MPVPRISVVVPIYNVEAYLAECLESLAGQTVHDLEIVMVDDGSTDSSAAIAERFAERDPRFRLIRQPNGGLSRARNTGLDAASGELLAFVDSDDLLPRNAYELLLRALDRTDSDFATGNVYRLDRNGLSQLRFVQKTFAATRLKTHVTRFRPLLGDRTAWNKLWRRSFWDAHNLRFPDGRVHEDIPVVLPAHFMASSVDVVSEPVYYYRVRESGDKSITQRRLELKVLLDRLAAVEEVHDYLLRNGPRQARRWYEESLVADDLRYFLDVLDRADDEYREVFLDRVNALLDRCSPRVERRLQPIQRLKWHLVRRRRLPELLEVLRFGREDASETPPVRVHGRWYADLPFRTDRSLRIPASVYAYRPGQGFGLDAGLDALRLDGSKLLVEGYAYIDAIGAAHRGSQRVTVAAVRRGRLRRLRARAAPVRARARPRHRPDVTAAAPRPLGDPSWSGFAATLDLRLLRGARSREGTWELYVIVRVGRLIRRRMRFKLGGPVPVRAVEGQLTDAARVRAVPTIGSELLLEVRESWAVVESHRLADGAIELSGRLRGISEPQLELRPGDGSATRRYPLTVSGGRFTATVPAHELTDGERAWEPWVVGGGGRLRLGLAGDDRQAAWAVGGREVALVRTRRGDAELVARPPRPVLTDAAWRDDGALELAGTLAAPDGERELHLRRAGDQGERHTFAMEVGDGRFHARLKPGSVPSLGGELPLRHGTWLVHAPEPAMVAPDLRARLPLRTVLAHRPIAVGMSADGEVSLIVGPDLEDDERGRFNALRLRKSVYAGRRADPLRETVVYSSFRGRQYSDSPRAVHEELVRRGAPLEHLWVVHDARCRVPETATVLRDGSREYYEALARSRYLVFNDFFPDWFRRRPDQVCLQTGHSAPLRRLGFDSGSGERPFRRIEHRWAEQVGNWQYVVSPNRFSTPILRRAYAIEGELLETGYPRTDALTGDRRDERARRVRERLGVPEGARIVLYAPTYRDDVVDRRGRYRLEWRLDAERLRDALAPDTVLLARKHYHVVDELPVDGVVRDVSTYPDGTELLLAADVLVTDYSSLMVDFATTGRPMLLYAYDLEEEANGGRGFYLDLTREAPGPLLHTCEELAEALRDPHAAVAGYDERYRAFAARFCELDDGRAAARVVDRLFET
jgi:CDP-glycerol glycerophosphotransferase